LIGLDAADWKIVQRLRRSGVLPNFEDVVRRGVYGPLKTVTEQPHGGATMQWTSAATGKRAAEHGILQEYASKPDRNGYTGPMQTGLRKARAIWNVLGDRGVRVGVAGWPVTWPAEPVNGFMVSHYLRYRSVRFDREVTLKNALQLTYTGTTYANPNLDQTFPAEFYSAIGPFIREAESVGDAEIFRVMPSLKRASNRIFYDMKWAYVANQIIARVGAQLLDDASLKFVTLVTHGLDPAAHRASKVVTWEPFRQRRHPQIGALIDEYYLYIDGVVGDLLAKAGDDAIVILVSQHGTEGGRHAREALDGVLAMRGPGLKQGFKLQNASLLDLFPTLLYIYGLPIPKDVEGRILTEAFNEEFNRSREVTSIGTYEDSAAGTAIRMDFNRFNAEIRKRTERIGYRDWLPGASGAAGR
jgi:predicted AlkP superfamily phosphohydrolase/phosphomutase